jgi:dienelactone hydrolase
MMRFLGLMLALALTACAGESGVSFPGPAVTLRGGIVKPEGVGPFPAVVLLHGCNGVIANYQTWARRLASWGYVALIVDSFGPRGIQDVCGGGNAVPYATRIEDAKAAAAYLRGQSFVQGDRIGVIGFSHGGTTAVRLVQTPDAATVFKAAVAFYPGCKEASGRPSLPALVLGGDSDDWTPVQPCQSWEQAVSDAKLLKVTSYPAHHGFDDRAAMQGYMWKGHWFQYDSRAAADSYERTKAFFDLWLKS